jgi:hypothetical protein
MEILERNIVGVVVIAAALLALTTVLLTLVSALLAIAVPAAGTLAIRLTLVAATIAAPLIPSAAIIPAAIIVVPASPVVAEVLVGEVIPSVGVVGSVGILFREEAAIATLTDIEEGTAVRVAALEVEVFVLVLADHPVNGADVVRAALSASAWQLGEDTRLSEILLGVASVDLDDLLAEFQ